MHDLKPCPSCSELLMPGVDDCPFCGRTEARPTGSAPRNIALVGLGLVFGQGCFGSAVYGVECTEDMGGACTMTPITAPCDFSTVAFAGTVSAVNGSPAALAGDLQGAAVVGQFDYFACMEDEDPDEARGVTTHPDGGVLFTVGAQELYAGRPTITVEDGVSDVFTLEAGMPTNVDGVPHADLVLLLSITDDTGASFSDDQLPATLPMDASMAHSFTVEQGDDSIQVDLTSLTAR